MAALDSGGGSGEEDDQQQDRQERGVVADEGTTQDSTGAADELTERDPGSGGGSGGGGGTRGPRQQADEQLTRRDPGSGGGRTSQEAGGGAGGSASAGSSEAAAGAGDGDGGDESVAGRANTGARGDVSPQSRQTAEQVVDTTLESGIEQRGVGDPRFQRQAEAVARDFIRKQEGAESLDDVAVRFDEENNQLVAGFSRGAAVDMASREIEEFTEPENLVDRDPKRIFAGTERVPVGVDVDREDLDVGVEETAAGEDVVSVSFDEETQRDIARQRFASTEGIDADRVEVEETEGGFIARTGEESSDTGGGDSDPTGFDRIREGVDVDIEPIQHRRESLEGGEGPPGGALFTPPSVDVDVDTGALGLPGRDDVAQFAPSGDTDVGSVGRSGPRRGPGAGASTTRGGFDPSTVDVDPEFNAENVSFIPSRETLAELAPSGDVESVERSGPRQGPGSGASTTRGEFDPSSQDVEVDVDVDVVPDFPEPSDGGRSPGDFQRSTRGRNTTGSPERTAEIVEPSEEAKTPDPDPVTLREIVGAPFGVAAGVTPDLFPDDVDSAARDADPQRRGPGSGPSTTRGEFDPSGVDVDPNVSVDLELPPAGRRFVEDVESGFPQGVEAGESDPPALEAGAAAGAARGRTVDPVRGFVTRSPLSPGRRARTVGKIVAGGVALGAGALTVEEAAGRLEEEQEDPTTTLTGTATEIGIDEGVVTTEIDVSEATVTSELEVSGDTTDVRELSPTEAGPTATTVEPSEPGRSTRVELPESDVDRGADTGGTAGDTVVPEEFPLPGRDVPRDPTQDRQQEVDPTDIVARAEAAASTGVVQPSQPGVIRGPIERQRIAEERGVIAGESALGQDRERAGFPAAREFPTGASAVVGEEVDRLEDAEVLDVLESETSVEDVVESAQRSAGRPDAPVGLDIGVGVEAGVGVDAGAAAVPATVTDAAAQLSTPSEQVESTAQRVGVENVVETPTVTETSTGFGQGFGVPSGLPTPLLPDGDSDRSDRRRGAGFFRREFIAPVEENPLSAIDEDLENL